jgi:hypothetical protein|tara:strand:+ start:5241 stop:5846 length:606 start_codon:yes stop_codon:yes gene_type:complete
MKDLSKLFSIILVLTISVFPLAAQDDADGEATEEVVEDEMFEEEMEDVGSPLAGFTAGLNVAYPVVTGEYYTEDGDLGPVVGFVVGTPYGLPLGPFNLGVGAGLDIAMFGNNKNEVGFFGTVNAVVYETPQGPISVYGGIGLLGGVGIIGGASFDYSVSNIPLVIKPYLRANISSSGTEGGDPTGWIQLGAMFSYDISTLF